MPEDTTPPKKYAPTISQLIAAAKYLPDPKTFQRRTIETATDGENGTKIEFERIKLVKSDGEKVAKWSFKGRVSIDSKFIGHAD